MSADIKALFLRVKLLLEYQTPKVCALIGEKINVMTCQPWSISAKFLLPTIPPLVRIMLYNIQPRITRTNSLLFRKLLMQFSVYWFFWTKVGLESGILEQNLGTHFKNGDFNLSKRQSKVVNQPIPWLGKLESCSIANVCRRIGDWTCCHCRHWFERDVNIKVSPNRKDTTFTN